MGERVTFQEGAVVAMAMAVIQSGHVACLIKKGCRVCCAEVQPLWAPHLGVYILSQSLPPTQKDTILAGSNKTIHQGHLTPPLVLGSRHGSTGWFCWRFQF